VTSPVDDKRLGTADCNKPHIETVGEAGDILYLECVLVCHTVSQCFKCFNVLFFVISSIVQHVRLTCVY